MSGPIPNLQFQPYNPMDTAIKTALSVFNAGMQGQNMRTQNQMNQASMPYIGPTAEAQMKQLQMQNQMYPELTNANIANMSSQNKKREADIRLQQQMMQMLGIGGGNEGQPMPAGGNMATGAGMPGMGGQQDNFGGQEQPQANPGMQNPNMQPNTGGLPGYNQIAARKYFNLPEMSPQEQLQMDLLKNQQNQLVNKQIETDLGTTGHLTSNQSQALGIENTLPILDELIDFATPVQLPYDVTMPWNINDQATYDSLTANITDKLVAAWGLPKNEKSFETIEAMVKRKPFETEKNYRNRLESLKGELHSIYGKVGRKELPVTETKYSQKQNDNNWQSEANMLGYRKGGDGKWYKD